MKQEEMRDRIKKIRLDFGLNQDEFSKRLSVTQSHICNVEGGHREVSKAIIKLICSEFDVNSDWLNHGIGQPYDTERIINRFIKHFNLNSFDKKLIVKYINLSEFERTTIHKIIFNE